jgi:cytochrome o ubiquinol oxidase subunit 1
MGATRRLNTYDASLGWQGLFIVSGIGILLILVGIGFQVMQIAYSIYKRKSLKDTTGDPWGARTLEWSTPSPVPVYNFINIPKVTSRDAFWEMKKNKVKPNTTYEDIELPKNSSLGFFIAMSAFVVCFALVWHIWWMAIIGIIGVITLIIIRSLNEDTEYILSAKQVELIDKSRGMA